MQAMNTPPDTSSALMFTGTNEDDSWTIFDQEIMALANPSWLYDEAADFQQTNRPMDQVEADVQLVTYNAADLPEDMPSIHLG